MTLRPARAAAIGIAILATVVVAACGGGTAPGSLAPAASGSAAAVGSAPSSGGSPAPGETPRPTAWPGEAVLGINDLGAGDNEIAKAVADFSEAVAAEDLVRMRGAAIGLQNLVTSLSRSVDRISGYPPMATMAGRYRVALAQMLDGSRDLVTALDAGDAAGIVAATGTITTGMQAYGEIRPELADWVNQAIQQQRLLTK